MTDVLKILLVFAALLVALRRKVQIGYALLLASGLLALLYTMHPDLIGKAIWDAVGGRVTIDLFLALSLIRIFERILREQDILSSMMNTVRTSFRNRKVVIVAMPMLIGMLPSLGGAYFSAPMVKEATTGLSMSQEEKAFVNYWFRHPWEYVLPLYPGVLLASAVSAIPLYDFISANMPYAISILITGFVFSMRSIGTRVESPQDAVAGRGVQSLRDRFRSWQAFLPIGFVLALVVGLHIDLHLALLLGILPLLLIYRYRGNRFLGILRHGFTFDVVNLIFGIMLFKELLEASGSVRNLSEFLLAQQMPVLPIICILPFVTGLLTGLTVGFVASTFPLLIAIGGGASSATLSLAFAAGFLGVLLSPVHLCLVLTREYFKADLWGVYQKILPAAGMIFIVAIVEYFIMV